MVRIVAILTEDVFCPPRIQGMSRKRSLDPPVELSELSIESHDSRGDIHGLVKILSSPAGLRMFKKAYRENMLYKIQRYSDLLERCQKDVSDAMDVIRIKMPDLKRAASIKTDDSSDNWHIFDSISGPYTRAKEQASQFEAILNRARERLTGTMEMDRVTSDDIVKDHRDALVQALRRLGAFSSQPHIIANVVDVVASFIKDPRLFRTRLMNFMLLGNAGTGKTSIAEAIGDVLAKAGIFVGNNLTMAGRGELVGQYMGETVTKTRQFLMSNLDNGVIFIDEAYAITPWEDGKPESYGTEATTAMVEFMTRYPGLYCIITAGYEKEMIRYFLPANEGLSRRFPNKFVLRTLSPVEMVEIFKRQLRRAQGMQDTEDDTEYFSTDAYEYLERLIEVCTEGRVTHADEIDPCTRRTYKKVRTFEPSWDYMFRVFEHHAGSMTTLADEAITVLYTTISFRDVITSQKKKGRHSRPTIRRQGIDVMRRAVIQRIRNMAFSDISLFLNQLAHVEHIILGIQTSSRET